MTCSDVKSKFSEIYDGEGDKSLAQHIEGCAQCKGEFNSYKNALESLKQCAEIKASDDFEEEVITAYKIQMERDELLKQTGIVEEEQTQVVEKRVVPKFVPLTMVACFALVCIGAYLFIKNQDYMRDQDRMASELKKLTLFLEDKDRKLADRIDRFNKGLMEVSPDNWKSEEELKHEWSKEHRLVEHDGMLLSQGEINLLKLGTVTKTKQAVDNEVTKFLDGLVIGAPLGYKGITIYPLNRQTAKIFKVSKLSALSSQGKVKIRESGNTFFLLYENNSEETAFIPAGTILSDGNFDRATVEDIILKPLSTGKIRTICAQPYQLKQRVKFEGTSGNILPLGILTSLYTDIKQASAWNRLIGFANTWKMPLKDSSIAGFYLMEDLKADLWNSTQVLQDVVYKNPDSVGMAVSLGDRIDGFFLFHDHELFEKYFEPVVVSALTEVFTRQRTSMDSFSRYPNTVFGVKHILEGMFFAEFDKTDMGYSVKTRYSIGKALINEDLISLSVFAGADANFEKAFSTTLDLPLEKIEKTVNDFNDCYKENPSKEFIMEISALNNSKVTEVILKHLDNPEIRSYCLLALGDRREVSHLDAILKYKDSCFPSVARSLAKLADENSVKFLKENLNNDSVINVIPVLLDRVKDKKLKEDIINALVDMYSRDPKQVSVELKKVLIVLFGSTFDSAFECRELWNRNKTRILGN